MEESNVKLQGVSKSVCLCAYVCVYRGGRVMKEGCPGSPLVTLFGEFEVTSLTLQNLEDSHKTLFLPSFFFFFKFMWKMQKNLKFPCPRINTNSVYRAEI